MVRNYKNISTRGSGYSQEDVDIAVQQIKRCCISTRQASVVYKVPYSTLNCIVTGKRRVKSNTGGRPLALLLDDERKLAKYLVTLEKWGFGLTLLSGTLKTYQRAGCDDEYITLKCPPGTSISVEIAQYGESAPSQNLCKPKPTQSSVTRLNDHGACLWPNALQSKWDEVAEGSWVRTVIEVCQKKRQCRFIPSPKTFGGDPCPGVRKYVEIAYKCRPYEFRSKVSCQNEKVLLKCNPNSRLAIYSASYGRTEYESIQCPQPAGVPEETCLVGYATERVMNLCHGKRSCDITADINTFGNPCHPESRMYLKVVYTCVPRKVLKVQLEGPQGTDELTGDSEGGENEDEFDHYDAGNEFIRESPASPSSPNVIVDSQDGFTKDLSGLYTKTPPHSKSDEKEMAIFQPYTTPRFRTNLFRPSRAPAVQHISKDFQADEFPDPNCTITIYTSEKPTVIGFISEWINAYTFVSQNQERFYLYLAISIAAAVVLCLSMLVSRLLVQRRRERRETKFRATTAAETSPPNGFTDDISEIDADIDLTTPLPIPAVNIHSPTPMGSIAEVVRYPHVHTHTLRRNIDSNVPRSLSGPSNTQYYYG